MMKHIIVLSFICFLFACHSQKDKNNFAGLIKGDWFGQLQSKEHTDNQTIYGCFEDSTYQFSLKSDTFKYEIRKDTLFLNGVDFEGHNTLNSFQIVKLTTDSLVLLDGPKQEYTLRFAKVKAKNKITPSVIYFGSSGCFGSCQVMYLEIDSSRNIRFYGNRHTSITGGFSGSISENEYNSIINKIRNLPIDSLREIYEASITDQATLGVSIVHENRITRSSAYGHDQEPIELHLLFAKLINLYKELNLQPDASVNESYFDSKLSLLPVMSPPPTPLRKSEEP